jgi:hypothetical protein
MPRAKCQSNEKMVRGKCVCKFGKRYLTEWTKHYEPPIVCENLNSLRKFKKEFGEKATHEMFLTNLYFERNYAYYIDGESVNVGDYHRKLKKEIMG